MTRNWRGWAVYGLAWVPVIGVYTQLLSRMNGLPQGAALSSAVTYAVSAALLGVLVWRASGHVVWPDRKIARFIATQIVLAGCFSLLWHAAILAHVAYHVGAAAAVPISATFAGWQLLTGLWVYGVIAGVSYALRLTGRLRAREAAAARAEALRLHAELAALRGQLNPHFLFDTLHTVSALVGQDPATAQLALEQFAGLLRYVLDTERAEQEEGILAEELAFVRDYLSLQQLRLGDRLHVVEQIDPDALDCVIPSLTLRPLVENAITHAISQRAGGGTITIGAALEDDLLILVISDDGPGAVAEGVRAAPGLGLRVGRQRLETRYPKLGRLTVTTAPGAGFTVTLSLPAQVTVRSGAYAAMRAG